MTREWQDHQMWVREQRANGIGADDRERPWHYGRDPDDEVHEPAPGICRVTRPREDDAPEEMAA